MSIHSSQQKIPPFFATIIKNSSRPVIVMLHQRSIFILLFLFIAGQAYTQSSGVGTKALQATSGSTGTSLPAEGVVIANPVPASPDAAALGKYGSIPVGYFTGIPDISIPIYTIKSGDLTLPVSLSYHGGGTKVEEIASSVGLGWVLNAGGVISRTVRGLPDENLNGYFDPNQYVKNIYNALYGKPSNLTYNQAGAMLNHLADGTYDGEADIFNFNFGGYSGQFCYTETGVVMISPRQDISFTVTYSVGNAITSIMAKTPDGVTWYFGGSGATEFTQNNSATKTCNSSWFLYKIVSPTGNEIDFTYKPESYTIYQPGGTHYRILSTVGNTDGIQRSDNDNGSSSGMHTVKLTGIAFENGNIRVFSNLTRADINPNHLAGGATMIDSLSINSTGLSKLYKFFYSNSSSTRLRLDSLVGQLDPIAGTSNYKEAKYSFFYNADPWSSSINFLYSQDWWGYYNGKNNSVFVPQMPDPLNPAQMLQGADRTPNSSAQSGGQLTQINYPEGGHTVFTFEANQQFGYTFGSNGNKVGGLRIAKIADYDGLETTPYNVRTYTYLLSSGASSGYLNYQPQFNYNLTVQGGTNSSPASIQYFVRTAFSNYPLATQHGSVVGYYQVQEYFDANGKKGKNEYFYSISGAEGLNGMGFPFAPPTTMPWHEGLITEQLTSKYVSGTNYVPLQKKISVYSSVQTGSGLSIKAGFNPYPFNYDPAANYVGGSNEAGSIGTMIVQPYTNATDYTFLSSDTTWIYDGSDSSKSIKTWNSYQMDPATYQLTQIQSLNSKNEIITQTVTYPSVASLSVKGVANLYNGGIVTYPIEEVTKRSNADGSNSRTVKAVLTSYKVNKPFRDTVFEFRSTMPVSDFVSLTAGGSRDSRYQPVISFDKYDAYGSIIQERKIGGAYNSYIWGYQNPNLPGNNTYPIAEVINADSASIAYTNFESYQNSGLGNWTYSNAGATIDPTAPMGSGCYSVSGTNTLSKAGLNIALTYVVSFWAKTGAVVTVTGGTVNSVATGNPKSGWIYYEYSITGTNIVTIGGSGSIDELRLYPTTAQMNSYTYTPLVGLASKCDTKNDITYFIYDNVGRLIQILDQNQNIIKQVQYNYQNSGQ